MFNVHKYRNEDYLRKLNNKILFMRLAGYVSMKHNYDKILALDFKLL